MAALRSKLWRHSSSPMSLAKLASPKVMDLEAKAASDPKGPVSPAAQERSPMAGERSWAGMAASAREAEALEGVAETSAVSVWRML